VVSPFKKPVAGIDSSAFNPKAIAPAIKPAADSMAGLEIQRCGVGAPGCVAVTERGSAGGLAPEEVFLL